LIIEDADHVEATSLHPSKSEQRLAAFLGVGFRTETT
jgi:hypothetical protein